MRVVCAVMVLFATKKVISVKREEDPLYLADYLAELSDSKQEPSPSKLQVKQEIKTLAEQKKPKFTNSFSTAAKATVPSSKKSYPEKSYSSSGGSTSSNLKREDDPLYLADHLSELSDAEQKRHPSKQSKFTSFIAPDVESTARAAETTSTDAKQGGCPNSCSGHGSCGNDDMCTCVPLVNQYLSRLANWLYRRSHFFLSL